MKTKLILIIGVLLLIIGSCERIDLEIDVPKCIKQEIKAFSNAPEGCKGASVWKYNHFDKDVYLFTPGDCENDRLIKLYDSDCNLNCTWEIEGLLGLCNMSPEVFYRRDDGELVWESK